MKFYVVADTHGFYSETIKAIDDAGFFDEAEDCRLVVLGDLLDRGREAERMIEFMIETEKQGKLIYVLGNHEDLFADALQSIARGDIFAVADPITHHYHNGTWNTLLQISGMEEKEAVRNPAELLFRVKESPFYRRLLPLAVDYFETKRYIFTHGYIPCRTEGLRPILSAEYNADWRDAEYSEWKRARWYNGMEMNHKFGIREPGKTVVCGHFHASYGHAVIEGRGSEYGKDADFSPYFGEGIIAIDACTAASGRVNCLVFEDEA